MKNTEDLIQAKLTILYAIEMATESGISLRSDTLIDFCKFWAKHIFAIPDKRKCIKMEKEQLLQQGVIVLRDDDSLHIGYCPKNYLIYIENLKEQE